MEKKIRVELSARYSIKQLPAASVKAYKTFFTERMTLPGSSSTLSLAPLIFVSYHENEAVYLPLAAVCIEIGISTLVSDYTEIRSPGNVPSGCP